MINDLSGPRGRVGPGQAREPDWWFVLEIDKRNSKGHWKQCNALVIQGQSKVKQGVGKVSLSWEDIKIEYDKCFTNLSGAKAKSMFVVVTDHTVDHSVTGDRPIVLLGREERDAFLGVAGSLKRQILDHVWIHEKKMMD
jgi:hypothetical protein